MEDMGKYLQNKEGEVAVSIFTLDASVLKMIKYVKKNLLNNSVSVFFQNFFLTIS